MPDAVWRRHVALELDRAAEVDDESHFESPRDRGLLLRSGRGWRVRPDGIDWQAAFPPRGPPTFQRLRVLPAGPPQLSHHPGACLLVPSGTVRDERCLPRNASCPHDPHDFVGRHAQRTARNEWVDLVRAWRANVQNVDLLPGA